MPTYNLPDIIGLLGIGLSLYAYARVQWQRDFSKRLMYSLLNMVSAVFLGISLFFNWNLPAFLNNLAWFLISLYGVYRCLNYMRKERLPAKE